VLYIPITTAETRLQPTPLIQVLLLIHSMSRHKNQVYINSSWNNFGLSQLQYSLSNGNPARHIFFLSLQLPLHHHLLHKCQSLPLSSSASYGNHLHLKQLMVKLDNTSLPLLRWKLSSNLRLQQTALR